MNVNVNRPALTPGEAAQGIIDYNTPMGMKLYVHATTGLDVKYDLKPSKLKSFLELVYQRAETYAFDNIINVPMLSNNAISAGRTATAQAQRQNNQYENTNAAMMAGAIAAATVTINKNDPMRATRNIIHMYGSVTLMDCQAAAVQYFLEGARKAQNSLMLFTFLSNSLTSEALSMLTVERSKYHVMERNDGVTFLKHLISKVQIDTVSTVNTLRNAVKKLDVKIADFGGNIMLFNNYVMGILNAMASYNENCPELLVNLFDAYCTINDTDFRQYIMVKRGLWEDGAYSPTPEGIMQLVENNYKLRLQNGTWRQTGKPVDEINAMKAQIETLKSQLQYRSNRTERDKKFSWKKVPPTDMSEVKKYEGREYNWCTKHKLWTIHKDSECKGVGVFKQKRTPEATTTVTNNAPTGMTDEPKVVVNPQLTTATQEQTTADVATYGEGWDL
jgi:hypothetical protein